VLPNLWDFIKEAGGVKETADLSKVTLIRGTVDAGKIETIDIEQLVSSADFENIPQLHPGDIVEVPRTLGGIEGAGLPKPARERRNIAFITGSVVRSGPVALEQGMDVLDVIVMAGGPTIDADLKSVKVISKHDTYSSVMTIDLEKYSSEGTPRRYELQAEDTVVLPRRKGGIFRASWGTLRDMLAVTATVVSTVVLIDRGTR
jgi:protein involved in polysaccharide export with SLBB domain